MGALGTGVSQGAPQHKEAGLRAAAPEGSAALKGPRQFLGIRPAIFELEPELGLKLGQTNPKIKIRRGTHKPAHNDSERFWADLGVFQRRSATSKL